MRLLSGTALLLLLAQTPGVLAASAGSGCPDGTVAEIPDPDFGEFSFLFDQFIAMAGGAGPLTDTKSCTVDAPFPQTDGFGVYSVDRRGYVFLNNGQSAEVVGSDAPGDGILVEFSDPADTEFFTTTRLGTTPGQTPVVTTVINLDGAGSSDDAFLQIDALDIAQIGFVTQDSVEDSIDQLARQQASIAANLAADADLLLGFLDPADRPTKINTIAAAGSPLLGATANFDAMAGFDIFGGIAGIVENGDGHGASGVLAALGARYLLPVADGFDLLAEASVWGAPNMDLRLSRRYVDMGQDKFAGSSADGAFAGLNARLGFVFRPDEVNEIVVSATASPTRSRISGYSETASDADNLFAATVNGQTVDANMVKATLAWSISVTGELQLTLSGAVGHQFAGTGPVANVAYVGDVTGQSEASTFVEYGAKLGWEFAPEATLSGFVFGTAGNLIAPQMRFGGTIGVRF